MNDVSFLTQPLTQALTALVSGQSQDSKRLLHGRGKTIPGCEQINVDWFAPVAVDSWPALLAPIGEQFAGQVEAILVQHRYQKDCPTELAFGTPPDQPRARRGQLSFELSFFKQQNKPGGKFKPL